MPKLAGKRQSRNVNDLREGRSGDPFFEVARRMSKNEKTRKSQEQAQRFKANAKRKEPDMNAQLIKDMLAAFQPGPEKVWTNPNLMYPQSLSEFPHPFAELGEVLAGPSYFPDGKGGLIPQLPWTNEGRLAQGLPGAVMPGTNVGFGTHYNANIRTLGESKPPQKSLGGGTRKRMKKGS